MNGSQPSHSLYGVPANQYRGAAQAVSGSKVMAGGVDYVGRNRCISENDTCEGPRAKGTQHCIGHLRKMAKGGDVA
jgi:hypothetical protein